MELLRFYSWAPNPRYAVWIEEIRKELRAIPVLTNASRTARRNRARPPALNSVYDLVKAAPPTFRSEQKFADVGD
jgi:hypothetical protein